MARVKKMPIRLAFRHEGDFWNVYLALPDTMKGSKLVGSILMGAITKSPERKEAFMVFMQEILADAAESAFGERPTEFDEQPAPDSEKAGHS